MLLIAFMAGFFTAVVLGFASYKIAKMLAETEEDYKNERNGSN